MFTPTCTLVLAILTLLLTTQRTLGDTPATKPAKVFLLVGQSNMAGRGKVEDQDRKPHPRVITLTKDNAWAPAVDPIHFDKKSAGVGLGPTFGKIMADKFPDDTIALVPCAVGGTSIDQWKPGGPLYKNAIDRAKIALKDGKLAGILWHQGESGSDPATYAGKAEALFAAFRKDLDAPNVPIVLGTLGEFYKTAADLNPVLKKIPDSVTNSACVDAARLKDQGDKTHFDAASYRELGKRYADAFLKLAK